MLRIRCLEPIAETSAQRGVASALIDRSFLWGLSFDGSFVFQFGTSSSPYSVSLIGSELFYDDNAGAFTSGVVNGIDLSVNGINSVNITGLDLSAVDLQGYIDDAREAAGQLDNITAPVFANKPLNVTGSGGDDILEGGNRSDTILGKDGDDTIIATKGKDTISGGPGEDLLLLENLGRFGGVSVDLSLGTVAFAVSKIVAILSGIECAAGTSENDLMIGDKANNCLFGLTGDDTIAGFEGADRLFGEDGNDNINGGTHADVISGGAGNDNLIGEQGADLLLGESGRDRLNGGSDNDKLKGGSGNDILTGGDGNDKLWGGPGKDRFNFVAPEFSPENTDVVMDLKQGDIVRLVHGSGTFTVSEDGGNALIDYGSGKIVLNNVIELALFRETVDGVTDFYI